MRRVPLIGVTASIAVVLALLGALALWLVLRQQQSVLALLAPRLDPAALQEAAGQLRGAWVAAAGLIGAGVVLAVLLLQQALGLPTRRLAHAEQQLADLRAQLERLAPLDELTGLANRRLFLERGEQMLDASRRYGDPCSLIVFRLQSLQAVTDRHGQSGADILLRSLGAYLRDFARTADLVARIGADAFALVLPHTGAEVARRAAERLREGLGALQPVMPDGQPLRVHARFGVAALGNGDADLAALQGRADAALERAGAGDAGPDPIGFAD